MLTSNGECWVWIVHFYYSARKESVYIKSYQLVTRQMLWSCYNCLLISKLLSKIHRAGLKILFVAPPATHANKGRENILFCNFFYQYIFVKTVYLFFILGNKYFKSINSKWTSSQTFYIFNTLMLFSFLLGVCEIAVILYLNYMRFYFFVPGTNKILFLKQQ